MTFLFELVYKQCPGWLEFWMKSIFNDWNKVWYTLHFSIYVMKYCHRWLKFGREYRLVADTNCNIVNLWCLFFFFFVQGTIDVVRFTFYVNDTTWVVYDKFWARQIELVTLIRIFIIVLSWLAQFSIRTYKQIILGWQDLVGDVSNNFNMFVWWWACTNYYYLGC